MPQRSSASWNSRLEKISQYVSHQWNLGRPGSSDFYFRRDKVVRIALDEFSLLGHWTHFASNRQPNALELVPKKLTGFFESDMFQLFDSERFLIDQTTSILVGKRSRAMIPKSCRLLDTDHVIK